MHPLLLQKFSQLTQSWDLRKDQEHARVIINHLKTIHKFTMANMGSETIIFFGLKRPPFHMSQTHFSNDISS